MFDYCNRSLGRLRQLGAIAPFRLLIGGPFLAYISLREPPTDIPIVLLDTRSGQQNTLSIGGLVPPSPVPAFLLSSNGVAAAIVIRQPNGGGQSPGASIQVLALHTQEENLDGASPPSEIANLQLYDCAAGCAPNTTIIAWTNNGAQRYAQITS